MRVNLQMKYMSSLIKYFDLAVQSPRPNLIAKPLW